MHKGLESSFARVKQEVVAASSIEAGVEDFKFNFKLPLETAPKNA